MAKKASKSTKKTKKTTSRSKSSAATAKAPARTRKNGSAKASATVKPMPEKKNGTPAPAHAAAPAEDERSRDSNGRLTDEELRKVKSGLTKKDLEEFRAMLLEKRAELLGDVQGMEAARAEGTSEHLSPEHMADMGSDAFDQEFTLGLMESERRLLNDIQEALARIERGTYGVCLESGVPIPRARLEIKPWARYTIDVVRERERRGLKV